MESYFKSLKKYKFSSTFYRNSKRIANDITTCSNTRPWSNPSNHEGKRSGNRESIELNNAKQNIVPYNVSPYKGSNNYILERPELLLNNDETYDYFLNDSDEEYEDEDFRTLFKNWAISHNISHSAIKDFLIIYNTSLKNNKLVKLPFDPRTILSTPRRNIDIINMKNGLYWHNGLKNCLENYFKYLTSPMSINLNFNIDGIPVFKSSKVQLWPILFTIQEIENCVPMVIGIYCGGKPEPTEFLEQFVMELLPIVTHGLTINGYHINVKIRCFVCDAPARSMIKGTVNFNSYHGCQKCCVIGEYDHSAKHMSFPRTNIRRRTNEDFRNKIDLDHHKTDSPLLILPINIVEDVIVCDILHQLHVGIMKRLLLGYTGKIKIRNSIRWDSRRFEDINKFLSNCTMPSEINRSVRTLDCVAFWKATEFHTFLHYIGPVILRDHLNEEAYQNFLSLFCAITICSTPKYLKHINVAEILLLNFIEVFISIYGKDSIVSNIHNLCHLTEEVKRFGPLPSFSSYPFENKLFQIKRLLRNGSRPLAQVAKRMGELNDMYVYKPTPEIEHYPIVSIPTKGNYSIVPDGSTFYRKIKINKSMSLSADRANKWFLTDDKQIVAMKIAFTINNKSYILGNSIKSKRNFFTNPMNSSSLDIYISKTNLNIDAIFTLDQIIAKFVCILYGKENLEEYVFIPLLHTI